MESQLAVYTRSDSLFDKIITLLESLQAQKLIFQVFPEVISFGHCYQTKSPRGKCAVQCDHLLIATQNIELSGGIRCMLILVL